jgi:putative methanogenesis marker protein 6
VEDLLPVPLDFARTAVEAAHAAGAVLRRRFREGRRLDVRSKGLHDFVTEVDHEAEAAVVSVLRALDPAHIFVKDRGFPPGDVRRCRANLGGARPGFFGHEFELSLIGLISHGLEALPQREGMESALSALERRKKKPLDPDRLKELFCAEEPSHG